MENRFAQVFALDKAGGPAIPLSGVVGVMARLSDLYKLRALGCRCLSVEACGRNPKH